MSSALGNLFHRSAVAHTAKWHCFTHLSETSGINLMLLSSSTTSAKRSSPIKATLPQIKKRAVQDGFSTVATPSNDAEVRDNDASSHTGFVSTSAAVMLNLLKNTANKATPSHSLTPPTASHQQQQDILDTVDRALLHRMASRKSTALSLSNMYRYASSSPAQRLRNAQFLHGELSIRAAQRAHELLHLPHGLSRISAVQKVARTYLNMVSQILSKPSPSNAKEEIQFTQMLRSFVLGRNAIPLDIASGLDEYLETTSSGQRMDATRLLEIEYALYRFFAGRVGLRFLVEHHILSDLSFQDAESYRRQSYCTYIQEQQQEDEESFMGCIHKNCDPVREVQTVVRHVTQQCFEEFGVTPTVNVVDATLKSKYRNRAFTYAPHHLHYMMSELLKNSCRAVVTRHAGQPGSPDNKLPTIRVVITKSSEDVTIKVCDMGGGIPRSKFKKIWSFVHTSVDETTPNNDYESTTTKRQHHVREFGLPLARVYARHFGGELILKSMEGHGVDAYLYLPVLGDKSEKVPDRETGLCDVFDFHEPIYEDM